MPSIIHFNHIHERTIRYLLELAEKNNIRIVHDSVEWYSACEFRMGQLDKELIWINRLNNKVIRKPIKVYAISEYLCKHFSSRGLDTCRIPVIMDVRNVNSDDSYLYRSKNKILLIYAGNPGRKDYLGEIIRAFDRLTAQEIRRIEFNVYGVSLLEAKKIAKTKKLSPCINVYGKVKRDVVEDALLKSDFAVLLRPEFERYAKAGFPTKSVEAMSHGVAMLCNISSDLGRYLKHGENAIICNGHTSDDFYDGMKFLLSLSRDSIDNIKQNARKTADWFDYRNYIEEVREFLLETNK